MNQTYLQWKQATGSFMHVIGKVLSVRQSLQVDATLSDYFL